MSVALSIAMLMLVPRDESRSFAASTDSRKLSRMASSVSAVSLLGLTWETLERPDSTAPAPTAAAAGSAARTRAGIGKLSADWRLASLSRTYRRRGAPVQQIMRREALNHCRISDSTPGITVRRRPAVFANEDRAPPN